MFSKKLSVASQSKMKTQLLNDINTVLYKFEKKQFNANLDRDAVLTAVQDIRLAYKKLDNSIGTGKEDISRGCIKVRQDLEELLKTANGNITTRFEDIAVTLIEDLYEIIDLENGLITEISIELDKTSRKQKQYKNKLLELDAISQEFNTHKNRVESEIAKMERDKTELDGKLLEESNPRKKQNIFREIKSTLNKISTLHLKSNQYSSCFNLLDSIKIYAKELVAIGDLSSIELEKAKIILNINRIRFVLDDPEKLQPLLNVIEKDLKKTKEKTLKTDIQIDRSIGATEDSYDEMNAYQNEIINRQKEKEEISSDVKDLETGLKEKKIK